MVEVSERWVPGDEVELFHKLSWKMAIVLDDCSWNGYLVRLVGSLEELEITEPELRVRQSYQNEQPQLKGGGVSRKGLSFDRAGNINGKVDDVNNNRDMKENINETNGSETDSSSLLVNRDNMKTLSFTMEAQKFTMETLINLTQTRHGRMKFIDKS
uniref:Agenet domain-containing protein n=1 Tax=Tanacetum cinerariifolium TaxID=118510 RepID=A0A6L2J9D5_TANCI|nr:hypothetical protein [Tanacetum cinerariifolium]